MGFVKYQHIERFGTSSVLDIEHGPCFIFPKIDGTNGSAWIEDGLIKAGSRNRELTLENDNAGFYEAILNHAGIEQYLGRHPTHRLFGEWLVPHSLKTYRPDAWRRFYVFDVCIDGEDEVVEYIPYSEYQSELEDCCVDYIPCIGIIENATYDALLTALERNVFLIEDGKGVGEGIVIKNYGYINRYGRTVWAKIVANEFKEKHLRIMGAPAIKGARMVEEDIVDQFCTEALIEKEYAKLINENGDWQSQDIPRLLSTVYHELITEETWNFIKKMKMPTVNFKTLNALVIQKIKRIKSELF